MVKYLCRKHNRGDLLGKTIVDQCKIDEIFTRYLSHCSRMCERIKVHIKG
jgi:hypothetical protein